MRVLTATCLFVFSVFLASASYAFDCGKLDFGAKLSDLDDGNFILYKQVDGVSYYNYVGNCRLQVHQDACPAISYAFVDGKYYARIIKVSGRHKEDILNKMKAAFGQQIKVKKSGVWTQYSCNMTEDVELKIKCNDKTGEVRSAAYSVKLRDQLARNLKNDPVKLAN
ncbi:hypothetical protein NNJEOMEG_03145 [Fundidesulfovibrio magnetotacticus]|uniref:Uncharacterized protein n=1 Tax=Fundidesulfovibrio magnetotacticus TaxID=2730080 RepID=A0A6V8LZS9_9BACT|nr:hypothetical protein [Fundidesulfovibrio magnetotacticus]GFK95286.1 hypothetical protein NNJEOMEG_03145 [Fundidesulfovibrio magnetotacticus]